MSAQVFRGACDVCGEVFEIRLGAEAFFDTWVDGDKAGTWARHRRGELADCDRISSALTRVEVIVADGEICEVTVDGVPIDFHGPCTVQTSTTPAPAPDADDVTIRTATGDSFESIVHYDQATGRILQVGDTGPFTAGPGCGVRGCSQEPEHAYGCDGCGAAFIRCAAHGGARAAASASRQHEHRRHRDEDDAPNGDPRDTW